MGSEPLCQRVQLDLASQISQLEKEKKNAPQEEQPQANTTPETEQAAEETVEEETFTVTREQMEQMELTDFPMETRKRPHNR